MLLQLVSTSKLLNVSILMLLFQPETFAFISEIGSLNFNFFVLDLGTIIVDNQPTKDMKSIIYIVFLIFSVQGIPAYSDTGR